MNFKKLALAAAVASLPVAGFSMEAMEDGALSGVTGQDGITLGIATNNLALDVIVHDKDGLSSALTGLGGTDTAGAIIIEGMEINTNGDSIDVEIDADSNAGSPFLNVAVTLPDNIEIKTGDISVGTSNGASDTGTWGFTDQSNTILTGATITLGTTNMNIQLGASEPQGNMIALDTVITNGVNIANSGILDANSGGGIYMDNLFVKDTGGANLTVDVGVDATATGLVIDLAQIGDATNGVDLQITNQRLGTSTSAAIGDVEIVGLNLNGTTITVAGH